MNGAVLVQHVEQLIADLDRARAEGRVWTYGLVQERLRQGLERNAAAPLDLAVLLSLDGTFSAPVSNGIIACCPLCGDPWEDVPTCEHALAVTEHDVAIAREALGRAADEMPIETLHGADGAAVWLRALATTDEVHP